MKDLVSTGRYQFGLARLSCWLAETAGGSGRRVVFNKMFSRENPRSTTHVWTRRHRHRRRGLLPEVPIPQDPMGLVPVVVVTAVMVGVTTVPRR